MQSKVGGRMRGSGARLGRVSAAQGSSSAALTTPEHNPLPSTTWLSVAVTGKCA